MNIEKRLAEINARKLEIRSLLEGNQEIDLEKIQKELEDLEKEERSLEEKLNIAKSINVTEFRTIQKPNGQTEEKRNDNSTNSIEYRKAFMDYVLRGTPIPTELRADANTKTTDIGELIPETVLNQIIEKLESTGMIVSRVTRTSYKGGVTVPVGNLKPQASWVAEGAGSDRQKKDLGTAITFAYHKLRCAVSHSLEVEVMALPIFEKKLIENVVEAMTMAVEEAIIKGDGIGKPKGILAETPVTGQALSIAADKDLTYATLCDAEAALPLAYENGAVWFMTKKTFMEFIKMTDENGQPIARVNYGINGRPERYLLGREVILNDYMASYASTVEADTTFAFLFNPKDYVMNTNYEMTIKKYEDNETDDFVTKAIMLVDGKVIDKNSLVTLTKLAAE